MLYSDQLSAISKTDTKLLSAESPFAETNGGSDVPIGSIISSIGLAVPYGYIQAIGTVLNKIDYPDYWDFVVKSNLINTYQVDANRFKIPDLRGVFLRGIGTREGNETLYGTRTIGDIQTDSIQELKGSAGWNFDRSWGTHSNPFYVAQRSSAGVRNGDPDSWMANVIFNAARSVRVSKETRPYNYSVNYFVRVI